jgi:hypothetical protein
MVDVCVYHNLFFLVKVNHYRERFILANNHFLLPNTLRSCSFLQQTKGVREDWRGLSGILSCSGLNPHQCPLTHLV